MTISSTTFRLEIIHSTEDSVSHEISLLSEGQGEDILRRFVGHLFIAVMPEEGIEEALTSLNKIFEFNVEKNRYQLPDPVGAIPGSGRIASVSEAPELMIEE